MTSDTRPITGAARAHSHGLLAVLVALALLLGGCVSQTVKTVDRRGPMSVEGELPEERLLDVGVHLFDPNIPEDWDEREEQLVFPEVRRAEARYMPYLLKATLEESLSWGAVRVLPRESNAVDVSVDAVIAYSDGETLELQVTVTDATGEEWFSNEYRMQASQYSYPDEADKASTDPLTFPDPFRALYARIADDMLNHRTQMADSNLRRVRQVAQMRLAAEFAPEAFGDYVERDASGRWRLLRLPADDDPMLARTSRIRDREYLFIDTLDEYYGTFRNDMAEAYLVYRDATYEQAVTLRELREEERRRRIAGWIGVAAGLAAAIGSDSYEARTAGAVGVIFGAGELMAAQNLQVQASLSAELLKQAGTALEGEITPSVIQLDDRTITLSGTVDEQYDEWKDILREIYREELGLPGAADGTPAASEASTSDTEAIEPAQGS